jgi:hypothetical protein
MSGFSATLGLLRDRLAEGGVVPYLGPGALALDGPPAVPAGLGALAAALAARVPVPGRIRANPWSSAQYIESRRHRLTLKRTMQQIFGAPMAPTALHRLLARVRPSLVVDAWYDGALAAAFAGVDDWGQVQGVSRAEYRETWWHAFAADGRPAPAAVPAGWRTLLYKPWGSVAPAANFLVSDSDFVEVLTEIDIQTPIPDEVRRRRAGRSFLFLGCRFDDQTARQFARQIMKRSAGRHWIVLAETPTAKEERFLACQGIEVVPVPLAEAVTVLSS